MIIAAALMVVGKKWDVQDPDMQHITVGQITGNT